MIVAQSRSVGNILDLLFPIPSAAAREISGKDSQLTPFIKPDYTFLVGTLAVTAVGGFFLYKQLKKRGA